MSAAAMFLKNFKEFDWVIFLAFGANLALFFQVSRSGKALAALLHRDETDLEKDEYLARMYGLREKTARYYAIYENVTAIFPLLGILGTVIALLKMTSLTGMQDNFLAALTSTFWGLIAAIIFKFLDSFLSYRAESNEVFLSQYEVTGKRYQTIESFGPDGKGAADEAAEHHH